ncbi:MAG: hypothetical protein H6634_07315 [Anaerolineales bacterium]|nr:hypothetical protein [Anaerolineales bacterium]MCB9111042.1 hypothetical protein [Anaerolineales bacterium]
MSKKMLFLTVLALVLAACMPSQSQDQQPTADIQSDVNTAVAGTMQVNEQIDHAVEMTVAAKELDTASEETAADSNVVLQATNTPIVIPSFTPTASPVPLKYTCAIVNLKPKNGTLYSKNAKFDIKMRVINTGTRPWPVGIDVKYVSGTNITGTTRVEIPKALQPGQVYDINLDGKAPDKKGYYMMTWLVDGPMCYGSIGINVK